MKKLSFVLVLFFVFYGKIFAADSCYVELDSTKKTLTIKQIETHLNYQEGYIVKALSDKLGWKAADGFTLEVVGGEIFINLRKVAYPTGVTRMGIISIAPDGTIYFLNTFSFCAADKALIERMTDASCSHSAGHKVLAVYNQSVSVPVGVPVICREPTKISMAPIYSLLLDGDDAPQPPVSDCFITVTGNTMNISDVETFIPQFEPGSIVKFLSDKIGWDPNRGYVAAVNNNTVSVDLPQIAFETGVTRFGAIAILPNGDIVWYDISSLCEDDQGKWARVTDASCPNGGGDPVLAVYDINQSVPDDKPVICRDPL